jgi:enoyl-[acyl-carrier-protein] reductase (NADH)
MRRSKSSWPVQTIADDSDGAAAITGQVLYVDSGYQIMGM